MATKTRFEAYKWNWLNSYREAGGDESVFATTGDAQILGQLGANIVVRDRSSFAPSENEWALQGIVFDNDHNI